VARHLREGAGIIDKGRHLTGAARAKLAGQLKIAYDRGASIRTLADGNGRSYGFVHRLLTEAGTTFRGRGGRR